MPLYRRGNVWHYEITINGKRHRGSCKTSDEKQAREMYDRLRADVWRGAVLKEAARHTVIEALEKFLATKKLKQELKLKGNERGKRLRQDDDRYCEFWKGKFAEKGIVFLDELTPDLIREIRDAELGRAGRRGPIKPATVDRHLSYLRATVRAAANKWSWLNAAPYVELYNEEEARERYLEPHEVQRLVDALPYPWNDMAMFAVSTGLRQFNVFDLRWTDVNLVTRVARFPGMVMKNGKPFSIALNETACEIIRSHIGRSKTHVFVDDDGEPFEYVPSKMWARVLQEAGLEDVRWHDLRHTWASLMRQNGVSLADLQEVGGWQSAVMVKRYAHINIDHTRQHMAVMDGLLRRRGTHKSPTLAEVKTA